MSADRLREAARVLRERAETVPDAPWFAAYLPSLDGRRVGEWIVDSPKRLIAGNIGLDSDPTAEPIADYIANAVHPGVGLALADWLDDEADYYMQPNSVVAGPPLSKALAVADQILGDAS